MNFAIIVWGILSTACLLFLLYKVIREKTDKKTISLLLDKLDKIIEDLKGTIK